MYSFFDHLKIRGNMIVVYYVYCMLIVNILPISGNFGQSNIDSFTQWLHSDTGEKYFNTSGYISLGNLMIYIINNYGMKHLILLGLLVILFVCNVFISTSRHWRNFIAPIIAIGIVCAVAFVCRMIFPLDDDKNGNKIKFLDLDLYTDHKGVIMWHDIVILFVALFGPIILIICIMNFRNKTIIKVKGVGYKGQLNTYVLSSIIMAGFVALYLRWEGLKSIVEYNSEAWKTGITTNQDWYFIAVFSWIILGMAYGGFKSYKTITPNPEWLGSFTKYHFDSILLPSSSFLKGQDIFSSVIIISLTIIFLPMKKSILNKWYLLLLIWVHAFFSQDKYHKSFEDFHKKYSNKLRDFEAKHHPSVKNALNDVNAHGKKTITDRLVDGAIDVSHDPTVKNALNDVNAHGKKTMTDRLGWAEDDPTVNISDLSFDIHGR